MANARDRLKAERESINAAKKGGAKDRLTAERNRIEDAKREATYGAIRATGTANRIDANSGFDRNMETSVGRAKKAASAARTAARVDARSEFDSGVGQRQIRGGSFGGGVPRASLRPGLTNERVTGTAGKSRLDNVVTGAGIDYGGSYISAMGAAMQGAAQNAPKWYAGMMLPTMEEAGPLPEMAVSDADRFVQHQLAKAGTQARSEGHRLSSAGQQRADIAKSGLGAAGQFAVDAAYAGTQMVMDIGVGWLTGLGMEIPMAVRSFGAGAEKARADGASLEEQLRYGTATAAMAYATSRLSNVAFSGLKAMGVVKSGVGDDVTKAVIDKLVKKLTTTAKGATALKAIATLAASFGGEFAEEYLEAFADPFVQRLTYNEKAVTAFDDPSLLADYLYEGLIGGVLGLVGGGTNVSVQTFLNTNADENMKKAYRKYEKYFSDEVTKKAAETVAEGTQETAQEAAGAAQADGQEKTRQTEQTARSGPETGGSGSYGVIEYLLEMKRVPNSFANEIIDSKELSEAFFNRTGIKLEGTAEQKRSAIRETVTAWQARQAENDAAAQQAALEAEADEENRVRLAEERTREAVNEQRSELERQAVKESGYRSYVRGMFMRDAGISQEDAVEIANDPAMRAEWEAVTGKKLPEDNRSAVKMIRNTKRDPQKIDVPKIEAAKLPDLSAYPALQKAVETGTVDDPAAVVAEAVNAVNNGVLQYGDIGKIGGKTENNNAAPARAGAAEQKAPGYYGNVDDADAAYLDRLAKAAGVSIERAPAGKAGNREGWIIGGRVYMSDGSEDVARLVAKHEVTHYMQEMAPEAYRAFRDYVENIYRGDGSLEAQIEAVTNLYRQNGEELSADEALDEMVSNYAGDLLVDEALIRKLAGENRNIGQRILDGIRDILRRLRTALGDEEVRQLDRAARLWEQALKETNRAYYQEGKRAAEGEARSMYAGEKAATADMDALARAKEMDAQNVSAETIRQETGWFKGMDGKWRFEIDDSAMRYERRGDLGFRQRHKDYDRYRELNNRAEEFMLGLSDEQLTAEEQRELTELRSVWGNTFRTDGRVAPDAMPAAKLADYVQHDALFEAYPQLREAALVFEKLPEETRGQYDRERNIIRVSEDLRRAPQETLLHEIQHAVQQIEGFARGASPEYWAAREWEEGKGTGAERQYNAMYKALSREQANQWTRYQELDRVLSELFLQDGRERDYERYEAMQDEMYERLYPEKWFRDMIDAERLRNDSRSYYRELYRNTAGEIEARDTERRRNFTEQRRRDVKPDLGDGKAVFAERGGKYLSAEEASEDKEILHLKKQIRANLNELNNLEPVANVKTPTKFPKRLSDRRAWVQSVLKTTEVDRQGFGKVNLGANQIAKGLTYAKDTADMAAFAAVPAVIKRGRRIMGHKNHKGNKVESVTFAAPVVINGKIGIMGVVVQQTKGDNYKAHKILMPDGSAFILEESKETELGPVMAQSETDRLDRPTSSASGKSVPQERSSVKGARELQQQVRRLTKQNKRLREQMKRTDVPRVQRKAVEQQAKELREAYGSKMDKGTLADRLEKLYGEMAARSSGKDKGGMSLTEIKAEARAIANDLLAEARGNVNPLAEEYADLRKEIRGTRIAVSNFYRGDFDSVGGYEAFRKRNMGTLKLGSEGEDIGTFYESLSEKNADMFPIDIVHPADQLIRISDVMEELKAVEGNPFENDLDHTAEYLAGEIEERFYDMPSEKPTLADKMEDKYHRQRIKDQEINAARLYAQQKAHEKELRAMEERFREENQRRIENQSASERRETIRKHAERLGKKLLRPTDKQHIPDDMRGAALAFVTYLDLESGYEMAYGKDGRYHRVKAGTVLGAEPTSRTAAARELQAAYKQLAEDDSSFTIDPDMDDYLDEIAKMGEKKVADMSRAELDTVWKVMQVIEHTISKADEMLAESRYKKLSAMAEALRKENGGKKDRTNWAGPVGMADRLINTEMLSPETYFSRLGEAGKDIFRQMRKAADRQTMILKEGTDRAGKLIEESGVSFKKADGEIHSFELEDGKLDLSTSQLMELYALSKRKAALEHIYIGGLKPVDATVKGKILGGSKAVKVTPLEVATMLEELTPEQKKLVDGLQNYLSGDLAKHGNEESRKVYGYSKFLEQNYWPIKVSRTVVASDPTKAAGAKTIPGYGMTKTLKPHAKNAVELRSAIDTFSSHLNQMATYAAWLGTNENITKLHNFKFQSESTMPDGTVVKKDEGTVKELLEKVYGKNGNGYLENLLADIAQGTKAGAEKSIMESGLSKFKAAKVGGNLRVIIQQPTAILRAMEMVDPKYFAAAKSPQKGWEKAVKYSPIAQWKDWGYFELDTGRSLRELMTGTENRLDQVKNAAMAPAGWADSVAWGHLWNAVEAETADRHPEMTKGSREFYEAVAERFGEVVDRTQVVDSVLHRSQIMRSSSYANKMATSFMSEPTKVYNMVLRDLYALTSAESEEAKKKAGKQLARTSAALVTSFAVNALAQSLVDGLRDDDREKEYWDKVADQWLGNFVDNFDPVGYIPIAKDAKSIVQGYTLERNDMQGFADLINAVNQVGKALSGESQKTVLAAGLDAAARLGDMIGLPVSNLKRDAEAIVRTVMIGAGAGEALYLWDKLRYSPEKAMGKFYDDMYRAMDTDQDTYELIYDDVLGMLQEHEGMTEEEAAAKIKSSMESRMKKALGLEKVSSLPVRYSAPGEDEEFDRIMAETVENDGDWAEAFGGDTLEAAKQMDAMESDASKAARVAKIGNMPFAEDVREDALEGVLSAEEWGRYQSAKNGGVSLYDWCDFYESVKDERILRTGKAGTESQKDVESVLGRMKLTDAQKTAIWNSYGWKKESPWS